MSVWTHVAAVFRVDAVRPLGVGNRNWDEIFGKECPWDADHDTWDDQSKNPDKYLPMGSEGSLKIIVWDNPEKSSLAAYTVTVFGDLRGYDDVDAIGKWFDEACSKTWIRQAVCHAVCENGVTKVWKCGGE